MSLRRTLLRRRSQQFTHAKIKGIRDFGISVLMAEQNAKRALEISDRAYVLVSGRCVYHGGGADVLNLDLGKVFFGRGAKR